MSYNSIKIIIDEPWLKQSIEGYLPQIQPRYHLLRSFSRKSGTGTRLYRALPFPTESIYPLIVHIYLHLCTTFIRRKSWKSLRTF